MASTRLFNILGLALWVVITFGIAAFASQFEPGEWYASIAKPSWTPPGWLFGPVWGLLYFSMSFAAWLVWIQRSRTPVVIPLFLYLTQLAINGFWS
jgi:translocator protein